MFRRPRISPGVFRGSVITAIVMMLISTPPAAGGVRAPLASSQTPAFTLDLPTFPVADGSRLDVQAQVYHPELSFLPVGEDRGLAASVRLDLKLARLGTVAVDTSLVFVLQAEDEKSALDPNRFGLLELSVPVQPGRWAVTARLVDLQSQGKEALGFLRGVLSGDRQASPLAQKALGIEADMESGGALAGAASEAIGILNVPASPAEGPTLSDPEFRMASGGQLVPNPERLYGVTQDTLAVYFEVRGASAGSPVDVEVEITSGLGGTADSQSLTLVPEGDVAAAVYRLPIGTFAEGTYALGLRAPWAPDVRVGTFSVSWSMGRLVQESRDLILEGRIVFEGDELDRFLRHPRAMQAKALDDFWAALDPTPGTARNEARDRFQARVRHAQASFRELQLPGALTDRGRTYIRFGPPTEVNFEVVPLNSEDLNDAIVRVFTPHQVDRPGIMAKRNIPISTALSQVNQVERGLRRNLNSAGQEGAFESWGYQLNGAPLFRKDQVAPDDIDMRFVFIDRMGTGEYRLEYSNLRQSR